MLLSMGSQGVRHDLAIGQKQPAPWLQIPAFNCLLQEGYLRPALSPAPALSSHCPVGTTRISIPHLKISLQTSICINRIGTLSESQPSPILLLFTIWYLFSISFCINFYFFNTTFRMISPDCPVSWHSLIFCFQGDNLTCLTPAPDPHVDHHCATGGQATIFHVSDISN